MIAARNFEALATQPLALGGLLRFGEGLLMLEREFDGFGHVGGAADGADQTSLVVDDRSAVAAQPTFRTVGQHDAMLDRVRHAIVERAVDGGGDAGAVVAVDPPRPRLQRTVELAGGEPEQLLHLEVPVHPVGFPVPAPRAEAADVERCLQLPGSDVVAVGEPAAGGRRIIVRRSMVGHFCPPGS